MVRAGVRRWILWPPLSGSSALFLAIAAIAVPTALRAAVNGVVTGCEFTPYLPFVLVAAVLVPWWQAALVALAAVALLGGLFVSPLHDPACFMSGAGIFLGGSAVMIGTVVLIRRAVASMQSRGADEAGGGIVFSLERGQVWAHWYGQGPPVLLGSQRRVAAMMEDFLAQAEVAKRLNNRPK